jgi:hypothetical protein
LLAKESGQEEKRRKIEKKLVSPPAHLLVLVKVFLLKNNVTRLEHPPYLPYLSAAYFCPFPRPRLKSVLKGRLLASLRMPLKSLKFFYKMISRSVSNIFTVTRKSA